MNLANLPQEISSARRFLPLKKDKSPADGFAKWENPQNQLPITMVSGLAGFAIRGHSADYLFVDFDHVLDDNGNFVNADAEKWYNYLATSATYCEKSISGHGLHFFFKPTADLFKDVKFTGGSNGSIFLDDKNHKIKIEVFYRQNRYCCLTGDIFNCEPCAPVVDGALADEIFQQLINTIAAQNNSAENTARTDLPKADFAIADAQNALNAIPCKKVERNIWATIGMALKDTYGDEGFTLWNTWSQTDPKRYSADVCQYQWAHFGINKIQKPVTIATLIHHAKQFGGYKPPRRADKNLSNFDDETKNQLAEWQKHNGTIKPDILPKIKAALDKLHSLSAETFTVNDAYNNVYNVALARAYGFSTDADNFVITLKKAKTVAKERIAVNKSGLAAKLSDDELTSLYALDAVKLKSLQNNIKRQASNIAKAHDQFRKTEEARLNNERKKKQQAEREAQYQSDSALLTELKAQPQSPERDEKIIQLIRDMCDWKHDKQGNPIEIRSNVANIDRIFPNDPSLDGLIGYDEFQQTDVFLKAPPWNKDIKKGDEFRDRDEALLQMYLGRTYAELTNDKLIRNAITSYSERNKFNEAKDFFFTLPKHDGTKRLETIFIDFLKADDTPYVREVTKNWFIAAIARIFHPGCDYQTAPILLGEQGIGKSYLLNKVGGKFYGTLVDDVSDTHAIDAIQKLCIVEIKEMAAMKKDVDANKRFIDSATDTRRAAYERRATKIKRHCVFIITTNNKLCLTDMTGNRRYPVIECHNKPQEYVEGLTDEYINQFWAEAWALYQEMFTDGFDEKKLALGKETQLQANLIAEKFTRDDLGDEIKDFLDIKILPFIIWRLLSKEQRRQYFIDGGRIPLVEEDIISRRRAQGGKNVQADIDTITDILRHSDFSRRETVSRGGNTFDIYYLYGSEYREHICPAEIFHECFDKADRRKSIPKILECLNKISGWTQGERFRRQDSAYNDQKFVLYRDKDNYPAEDNTEENDEFEPATKEITADVITSTQEQDDFDGVPVKPADTPPEPPVPLDPEDLPF